MAIMPGTDTSRMFNYKTPMDRYDGVVHHVAVSESKFPHYLPGTGAHFYVRKDGTIVQQIDTKFRGGHCYQGNARMIGIETQGGVKNANGEPWTDAQVEALGLLDAWLNGEHDIPLRLMESSLSDERGLGWHRLGIDGNFGSYDFPGRVSGGELWSRSRGKICPGDAKIAQMPLVLARAIELAGVVDGGGSSVSTPKPKPQPSKPSKGIAEDGYWGKDTTTALQRILGTPIDGEVSSQATTWRRDNPGLTSGWEWAGNPRGSRVIAAMQRKLGVKADGLIGPNTINALSKRYGIKGDGHLDGPSLTIKAMQARLNDGKF